MTRRAARPHRRTLTILLTLAAIAVALATLHLIYRPPSLEGRTLSTAVPASPLTRLGHLALTQTPADDHRSGVLPLLSGPDAFALRIALVRAAEVAIDAQYYIWKRDATGLLLLDELRQAAQRGVRVRLLLDDNGIGALDDDLAALDALPHFEVRLFNPFMLRRFKPLGYAFDFARLNRRMHNKSLTVDGALSILGGRNIGDVYFGFGSGVQFLDTDVLVAGPVAEDIGTDFDRYWHSGSAHPVARIVSPAPAQQLATLQRDAAGAAASPDGRLYLQRLQEAPIVRQLRAGQPELEWTRVTLVSDDPAKGLGQARDRDLLFPQLMALLTRPGQAVDLVSAYFVPGQQFTEAIIRLQQAGVRVRILTNSQAATDVVLVHGAYARYRPRLLEAGVELLELRREFSADPELETAGIRGSSSASLHSKIIGVDQARVFIGSYNFDPRSLLLNTEMGVLIDSPSLTSALAASFQQQFRQLSYRPRMTSEGNMVWEETAPDGSTRRHDTEPGTTWASRLAVRLVGWLPIESLL